LIGDGSVGGASFDGFHGAHLESPVIKVISIKFMEPPKLKHLKKHKK
jgi:hypothetical protein